MIKVLHCVKYGLIELSVGVATRQDGISAVMDGAYVGR